MGLGWSARYLKRVSEILWRKFESGLKFKVGIPLFVFVGIDDFFR